MPTHNDSTTDETTPTVSVDLDTEAIQDAIEDAQADLRREMAGHKPGALVEERDDQYRLSVAAITGDLSGAIADHVAVSITEHNERFNDVDPADIDIQSIHIETKQPSYIEFFISE